VVPLATHDHWCGFRGKKRFYGIVPDSRSGQGHIANDTDGVYEYALQAKKGGGQKGDDDDDEGSTNVAELFGEFSKRSLCAESWDFILECITYHVSRP